MFRGVRAMLVAAGFGTRLDPLTRELHKPALPVGNRPAAWFSCDHLVRHGVREVLVNTHHLADRLRAELERHAPRELALRFVHEPGILGTGGGVRNAWRPEPDEDLLVCNAKLIFAPDLERALRTHRERRAIATMVLRELPVASSFAPVEIDGERRVRRIRGQPASQASPEQLRRCMYTGVQILSARAWADLPEQGDIIEHAYLRWLARGEVIAAVVDDVPWIDVGVSLGQYLDANLALATGAVRWPGIDPDARQVLAASSVHLARGVTLAQSVLGEGSEVAAGATLHRVVAWPGAHIEGDLSDAIVTTAGQIVRVSSRQPSGREPP